MRTPAVARRFAIGATIFPGTSAITVAQTAPAVPTYTKDVAPILFKKCVECHRAGEVGQSRRHAGAIAHFDNSANNKYNPSPEKEVFWAEQSWDEMFSPFIEYEVESLNVAAPSSTRTQKR